MIVLIPIFSDAFLHPLHKDNGLSLLYVRSVGDSEGRIMCINHPDCNQKETIDEIKKEAKRNNLSFVYSVTGENALHKLYKKNKDMMLCENNINSYIISLKNNKKLDWISYKHG